MSDHPGLRYCSHPDFRWGTALDGWQHYWDASEDRQRKRRLTGLPLCVFCGVVLPVCERCQQTIASGPRLWIRREGFTSRALCRPCRAIEEQHGRPRMRSTRRCGGADAHAL